MAERWVEGAIPPSGRRCTDHATRVEIRRRYVDCEETCAEIGATLGLHGHTVWRVLRDSGVQTRPQARRPGRGVA